MDIVTLGAAIAIAKTIPDTAVGDCTAAKVAAEAAAQEAKDAASSINSPATVQETKTYLRIN